ncbi:hypothetical protein [Ehrlichia minasensis]|nr:hypothetical protein [Ehrlichia minasensis]
MLLAVLKMELEFVLLCNVTEQKLILCRMKAAFDVCKADIKSI